MEIDKVIHSYYVIAADKNDDTVPYTGDPDCFVYFNNTNGWGIVQEALAISGLDNLAKALELAKSQPLTRERKYIPFPVLVETKLKSSKELENEIENQLDHLKREAALAKLTDEDKQILGLPPYDQDIF